MGAGHALRILRHGLAATLSVLPGAMALHLFGHRRGRAPDGSRDLATALPPAQPVLDRFPVGFVDAAIGSVPTIHDGPFRMVDPRRVPMPQRRACEDHSHTQLNCSAEYGGNSVLKGNVQLTLQISWTLPSSSASRSFRSFVFPA